MVLFYDRREVRFNDYVVVMMIVVEFFQFTSVGPDTSEYDNVFHKLGDLAAMNLDDLIDFKGDFFWLIIYLTLIFAIVSIVFGVSVI